MNIPVKFFPTATVALSIMAACVYGFQQDWRHTIYWIASAVLIAAVTY
jgi:hypothetical protein